MIGRLATWPAVRDEALLITDGRGARALVTANCFEDPVPLVDDAERPITPLFGVGVDLDGNGEDTLVWGHR